MTTGFSHTRAAHTHDMESIAALLSALGYPCPMEDLCERFTQFLKHSGYGVFVCEVDNCVAGMVAWSKSLLFVRSCVRFHIESLVVAPQYRGMGIGKKLLNVVETLATKEAPAVVDLTSGVRRAKDGTHDFYARLGYTNEGAMQKLYLHKKF